MKIATWNVNSVKARLEAATAWLKEAVPDVVCLQEIKCTDDTFPTSAFEDLGYNCAVHGQKTYNGVAILSKRPLEDVTLACPAATATSTRATSRRWRPATRAWYAWRRSMRRTAIRSAPTNSPTSSSGWNACTSAPARCLPSRNLRR